MPAFQDFGPLSERRKAEQQRKRKKNFIIFGSVALILIVVISIATIGIIRHGRQGRSCNPVTTNAPTSPDGTGEASVDTSIKAVCSKTDYIGECERVMKEAAGDPNKKSSDPKVLIGVSIEAISVELEKAMKKSRSIKSNDIQVSGAVEDCDELFGYAMEELNSTKQTVDETDLNHLPKQTHELKNWLSAVVSYQMACVEGFPQGDSKDQMKKAVETSRKLTSNALAIVDQMISILSSFQINDLGFGRRLMSSESDDELIITGTGGMPSWVSEEDRRILKERKEKSIKPNVVVAKDGSGQFKTITEALVDMPKKYVGRYVIYVKAGVYDESPTVTKKMENVTMYGDGSKKTIVTGKKNYVDGTRTFQTATFVAVGDRFMAISMGFVNTAGAIKHQAVAIRVQSDSSIFLNCLMDGYQDTLYAQAHRQFYRSCVIKGTIDFIFGDAAAVFQNCKIIVLRPLDNQKNIVTAHGRSDRRESTGYVLHRCKIFPDAKLVPDAGTKIKSYLGRPWQEYARSVIMESSIGGFIDPEGYLPWDGDFALKTLYYAEYGNEGDGASMENRVKWPGVHAIKKSKAEEFTVAAFIQGGEWIKDMHIHSPVRLGLYK